MADYWTQFSFVIDALSDEQLAWWLRNDKELREYEEALENGDVEPAEHDPYMIEDFGRVTYSYEINEKQKEVWFHSDEGCNMEGMDYLIQQYLGEMDPERVVSYQWSGTCSKPRLDAFCGGVVAISKNRALFQSTSCIEDEFRQQLKEELENQKGRNDNSSS